MTRNPHPVTPEAWVDRVDLDDIFRDAKPIGDGSEWTVSGFFESDDEHAECEFRTVCGGSRSHAFATTGNPLAEDPSCLYQPVAMT